MSRGIYKIINVVNNKFYVGSAVNFRRRKIGHWHKLKRGDHANRHLQAAWNKYGAQAFVFVIVEELADSVDLLEAENRWLKEHVGKEYCYNIARDSVSIGLGTYGELNPMYGRRFSHTPEAKEKIRLTSLGRRHTDESRSKIKKQLIGKPKSAETRAKISATLSGEGNYWYGKQRSKEFVEKVRQKVRVTQPDGTQTEYPSIAILRGVLGLKPPTVNRALKSGKTIKRGKYCGWLFEKV